MTTAEGLGERQSVPDYLQRFELATDPFSEKGDYFYAGADRRNCLDQIVHYCRFSEQLVVLTAEKGSGKTALVDATLAQLHTVIDCCRIPAANISSSESIVAAFARVLELSSLASPSIKDFLSALSARTVVDEQSEPVLVVVEDAECLPLAHLESLLKLHELARSSMHLMLVGGLPLKRRMVKIASDNPNIKSFSLRPLSLSELEPYILSRLQSVGYTGESPLSQDQLIVLHEQSGGIFSEVNRLMPLLLDGSPEGKAAIKREWLPVGHKLALGGLVVALAAGLILEFGTGGPVQPGEGESVQRTAQELAVSLPGRAVERAAPVSSVAPPAVVDTLPDKRPPPAAKPKPIARSVVVESVAPAKAPAVAKTLTSPQAVSSAAARAAPAKPYEPVAVKVKLSAREQRLLALDGGAFMLQILGSSSEQGVRDYVKQYVGRLPVSYFETEMRQKPWYVVLAGPYASRERAEQAVLGFPQDIQKQLPWVRSVDSIQLDIRARLKR